MVSLHLSMVQVNAKIEINLMLEPSIVKIQQKPPASEQGYRKLPPPCSEALKLDPGGCVLEAPSKARINFWKRASGLLSTILVIYEASPSEACSRNLEARFRGGRFRNGRNRS